MVQYVLFIAYLYLLGTVSSLIFIYVRNPYQLHQPGRMDGDADLAFDVESPLQLGGGYFYLSLDRWIWSLRFMDWAW
jgi:hypothetical protein